MSYYIDIHSHNYAGNYLDGFIAYPTLSITDDAIYGCTSPFWCGLHPKEDMEESMVIERLSQVRGQLIGVGEIGLDKLCGAVNQELLFTAQLRFAIEENLPVTIHCVRMYNELIEILKRNIYNKIIIHSFIGSAEVAHQLMTLGCYLSFSAVSLSSPRTIEALRDMTLDRLFIESDDKGSLINNYRMVAKIKELDIDKLKEIIYDNHKWLIG